MHRDRSLHARAIPVGYQDAPRTVPARRLSRRSHRRERPGSDARSQDQQVNPVITIDERRRVEVEFQGHDPDALSDSDLRKALTFDAAASADDVEAENSAHELRDLLQTKGYFDALVTWTRDRIDTEPLAGSTEVGVHFDRITYHLVPGRQRRVVSVDFAGNSPKVMPDSELAKVIATKPSAGRSLFGATTSATSAEIILDQERIKEAYRKIGYLEAQAFPTASITKSGLTMRR